MNSNIRQSMKNNFLFWDNVRMIMAARSRRLLAIASALIYLGAGAASAQNYDATSEQQFLSGSNCVGSPSNTGAVADILPADENINAAAEINKAEESSNSEKKSKHPKKVRANTPCLSWIKLNVPSRAVLLCIHGLGLNSDSFTKFGTDMSMLGIETYAIDVRGFGSWMQAKGHQKVDFKDCVSDVRNTLEWLRTANPNKPIFLMGESMGGAIVLHSAAAYPDLMDGLISVCSSGDRFKQKKTDLQVFLHALTGPERKFDIGKEIVDQATGSNTALKQEWEGDPLDRMNLSPLELLQFQDFMNENHKEVEKITKTPVLMVQGSNDKLVKPEGTEELFNELKTPDKEMVVVQNARHLIFEDDQFSEENLMQVANWIFKHSPSQQENTAAAQNLIQEAIANIETGQPDLARGKLQAALQLNPGSARASLFLGVMEMRSKDYVPARRDLQKAARVGQGTETEKEAQKMLQMMQLSQKSAKAQKTATNASTSMPSVLVFGANWCKPFREMKELLEETKETYSSRANVKVIDIDDPKNASLVEQFAIGPIPATVFLRANGSIESWQIGYGGEDGLIRGLRRLIPLNKENLVK